MGCILHESGLEKAECSKKVASVRRVEGAISSLVNTRDFHFECTRVLHEILLVLVLMYDTETVLWKEKEKSRLGRNKWRTSEVCWVLEGWIETRM